MENLAPLTINIPSARSYTQCVAIVQRYLNSLAEKHGALKQWCLEKELDYKAVVKVKNGSLAYYAPLLIQQLLLKFGYDVSVTRNINSEQKIEDVYIVTRLENTPDFPVLNPKKVP